MCDKIDEARVILTKLYNAEVNRYGHVVYTRKTSSGDEIKFRWIFTKTTAKHQKQLNFAKFNDDGPWMEFNAKGTEWVTIGKIKIQGIIDFQNNQKIA